MATYLKADGTEQTVYPASGTQFTLKELQDLVHGRIELCRLPNGAILIVNEDGKNEGLPENAEATKIWKEQYPIEQYPYNNDELVVGDVVLIDNDERDEIGEEEPSYV